MMTKTALTTTAAVTHGTLAVEMCERGEGGEVSFQKNEALYAMCECA